MIIMLARLICLILGHVLDEFDVYEGPWSRVYVGRGACARCGTPIIAIDER